MRSGVGTLKQIGVGTVISILVKVHLYRYLLDGMVSGTVIILMG